MGRTGLKADTKNTWFYIAGALATVQAARFTGIFLECLSASTPVLITSAINALIFIFFAITVFFYSSHDLKKTWIPALAVCIYMSAISYDGLFNLIKKAIDGGFVGEVVNSSLVKILGIALAVLFIVLAIVYCLKCFGKFQTRKPVLTCATLVLALSYALLTAKRLALGTTVIDALFVLDFADPVLGIPLCFTSLTLSLKR